MSALGFALPPRLEATSPPEERGLRRDEVRLMVAAEGEPLHHTRFEHLAGHLRRGDLLVVNVSATLPAAIGAVLDGEPVRIHVSTRAPNRRGDWRIVELRTPDGADPLPPRFGAALDLDGGARLTLAEPFRGSERLSLARFDGAISLERHLHRHGEPIRYGYTRGRWPLRYYQTIFARVPGSSEMPSAGRPLSRRVLGALRQRGVGVARIVLHCGVSSPERHEPPMPEPYEVPTATARAIARTRGGGGRVIAVGTTAVRALETVAGPRGEVVAGAGWTDLVISPDRGVRAVDGMITGWHEPEASHLDLLAALAGEDLLAASYASALAEGYLFHEFGDSHLILPPR